MAILAPAANCISCAADDAKIRAAISKAQSYLLETNSSGGYASIAFLAYVKSGGDKRRAAVQQTVEQILKKVSVEGTYRPTGHHNYEASVDLMLLEAVNAELYVPQMEAMIAYLLANQQSNGSWYYDNKIEYDCGDTSITQYVVMAMWAAMRAGIEIPIEVWEKTARWHIERQQPDGGFVYHPFESKLETNPEFHRVTTTMTAAGTSSLLIIRRMLFDEAEIAPEVRPVDSKRRFGVLEKFVDERPATQKKAVKGVPTMKASAIDKALEKSSKWIQAHWGERVSNHETHFAYHLYTIERIAALMDVQKLGGHDWYQEGAEELLRRQAPNGSWTDICQATASTAMSLMFLSKATSTIAPPVKRVAMVGGGLQAGGRGLPDNLDAVQSKDGNIGARKLMGPVDTLLIELERSSEAKVEDIQAAVVEAVQLDRPEDLIGQTARLKKLAKDPRTEVRRTALWALGRSGDVTGAKSLIEALDDPEPAVFREASLGLCILTRRMEGCGQPVDPLEDSQLGLTEESTEDERNSALLRWKIASKKAWSDWYLRNRPYDERDDQSTLKQNNK